MSAISIRSMHAAGLLLAGCCLARCISELAPGIQLTHGANSSLVGTSRHRFLQDSRSLNNGYGRRREYSGAACARGYGAMAAVLANMMPRFLITERASKAFAPSDPLRPTIALPRLLPGSAVSVPPKGSTATTARLAVG